MCNSNIPLRSPQQPDRATETKSRNITRKDRQRLAEIAVSAAPDAGSGILVREFPSCEAWTIVPAGMVKGPNSVSIAAIGLWTHLATLDEAETSFVDALTASTGRGKGYVRKLLNELEDSGWLIRLMLRGDDGQIGQSMWAMLADAADHTLALADYYALGFSENPSKGR